MKGYKTIAFQFPEKLHVELKARLFYDEVPLTKFIRAYIEAYLGKDQIILDFLEKYKEENSIQNKKKREKTRKLISAGNKIKNTFVFSEEEVENIYDVLEDELDEIEI